MSGWGAIPSIRVEHFAVALDFYVGQLGFTAEGAAAEPHASIVRGDARLMLETAADLYGDGYVDLAVSLGVPVERIVTIIDFAAAGRTGARVVFGADTPGATALTQLAELAATGALDVPVRTFGLEQVRDAYAELEKRHTRGKIVLVP